MSLPRLENAQVKDQRVLLRADLADVLDGGGRVQNTALLNALKPTVELLRSRGAEVLIAGHAGTPDRAPGFAELATACTEALGLNVEFSEDGSIPAGGVGLYENLFRVYGAAEAKGDGAVAKKLAGLADHFVNDAFGASAENYASLTKLPQLLPAHSGLALYKEVDALQALLNRENRPFVLILGGVQLERKLALLGKLIDKIDSIFVTGGLAYTFLKSRALPVGSSFVEKELEVPAFQMIEKAELSETEFFLPVDHVVAEGFSKDGKTKTVAAGAIPDRWMALDIGPKSVAAVEKAVRKAGCVFWYGPAGAVEIDRFQKGSRSLAAALAKSKAHTVAAGVDTLRIIHDSGLAEKFAHVSGNSAAALDFLLGRSLPGLDALRESTDD